MVALEPFLLVQAHRAQGRADGSAPRSEDGACHEHLNVLEDTLGEEWREEGQHLYHLGRWATHFDHLFWPSTVTRAYPTPFSPKWLKSSRREILRNTCRDIGTSGARLRCLRYYSYAPRRA